MKKEQIEIEREYSVVKSNDLIRKARYRLSANQQKVILYTISKIKPEDADLKEYEFSLLNLCEVFGLNCEGHNFEQFADNIKELSDKSYWVDNKSEHILLRWFSSVRYDDKTKKVYLSFDPKMKPFLIHLKDNFTVYKLEYVLPMKSRYAIRLYEILKSLAGIGEYSFSLNDLKELMGVEEAYDRWSNFKVRVLDKALEEVNKFTDLNITYTTTRNGHFIEDIIFCIKKKPVYQRIAAEHNIVVELDGEEEASKAMKERQEKKKKKYAAEKETENQAVK